MGARITPRAVPRTAHADVAQLAERWLPKPKVAGSRPVVRFTLSHPLGRFRLHLRGIELEISGERMRWKSLVTLPLDRAHHLDVLLRHRLLPQPDGFEGLAGFLIEPDSGDTAAANLENKGAPRDSLDAIPPS